MDAVLKTHDCVIMFQFRCFQLSKHIKPATDIGGGECPAVVLAYVNDFKTEDYSR